MWACVSCVWWIAWAYLRICKCARSLVTFVYLFEAIRWIWHLHRVGAIWISHDFLFCEPGQFLLLWSMFTMIRKLFGKKIKILIQQWCIPSLNNRNTEWQMFLVNDFFRKHASQCIAHFDHWHHCRCQWKEKRAKESRLKIEKIFDKRLAEQNIFWIYHFRINDTQTDSTEWCKDTVLLLFFTFYMNNLV